MIRLSHSLALVLSLTTACKKTEPAKDPVVAPIVAADAAMMGSAADAATVGIALGSGETYWGGAQSPANTMEYRLEDGSILTLVVVNVGTTDGRSIGVLRAYHDGKAVDLGERFELVAKDSWAELKQLANGAFSFRFGDTSDSRHARNAYVLRWDPSTKSMRLAKRWTAGAKTTEPEWITTGTWTPPPKEAYALCAKVVTRVVACAKDEEFKTALFARDAEDKRDGLKKDFDTWVTKWNTPANVQKQCEAWASDTVVETTFADPQKLTELAKDAGEKTMNCGAFGREVVDEGGIPRA